MKPHQSFGKIIIFLYLIGITSILAQDDSSACDRITCSNKGTCTPNEAYARGFWCECEEGWAGQDCSLPEPTVRCGDEEIEVAIDRELVRELEIDDNPRYVYFGHSSASNKCRAQVIDNSYILKIRAPYSSCGTQVIQKAPGDDYTFSNTVVWNSEVQNSNSVINRNFMLLDFKCIYEDTYTVSGPSVLPTLNVLQFANEKGQFEVRMRIYEDSSYAPEHEYRQSPSITIGSFVYVQVELAHVKDSNLVVTMDECFASQSPEASDVTATKHWLVTERCADEGDSTVQILYNGESSDSRFKFQMFKWRWSSDAVYLHCRVDICNKDTETCTGEGLNCKGSGGFRKKREVEGTYSETQNTDKTVSMGPIHVEVDQELLDFYANGYVDEDDDTTIIFLAAMFGLILLIAVAVVIIIIRRRNIAKLKKDKQLTETSQRLTSLKFTTEAF